MIYSCGITPDQYHAGLNKLWAALHLTTVQDKDVFTLVAERIADLEKENDSLLQTLNSLEHDFDNLTTSPLPLAASQEI